MAVAYDSLGVGQLGSNTTATLSLSWTHTPVATPNANTCVVVPIVWWMRAALSTLSATYDGVPMNVANTQIFVINAYTVLLRHFFLFGPPSGAKTVAVSGVDTDITANTRFYGTNSVMYSGTAAVADGGFSNGATGATPSITVPSLAGERAMGTLTCNGTPSAPNQTVRFSDIGNSQIICQDATGASPSIVFNETQTPTTQPWMGLGLRLQPIWKSDKKLLVPRRQSIQTALR